MKTLVASAFVLLIAFNSYGQFDENKALYMAKYEKYKRMKSTGTALTLIGTGLSVVGFISMMNATYTTTANSYGQTTTSSDGAGGAVAYLVGSCAVGAGVPLWIVGGINKGKYERKLQQVSVRINAVPNNTGVTLSYKF